MKVFLLFRDRDLDLKAAPPWNEAALGQDLELPTLFAAMAGNDTFLHQIAKAVVLQGGLDPNAIRYRQAVLRDCVQNDVIVREMFEIALDAFAGRRRYLWSFSARYPSSTLLGATELLGFFVGILARLRRIADEHASRFSSEGFGRLFAMLKAELSDEYLAQVQEHL